MVLAEAEVVIPLGALVDIAQERARLEKELNGIEGRLGGAEAKLANEGFRTKAPAEVVRAEQSRAVDLARQRDLLRERLEALTGL